MPEFWWVNHNKTVRQEIDGQYLWSPKTERNGARSEFYNNMRRASPDDLVLSYASQVIRYVGRVTEFAFTALKPVEFGTAGAYWNNEGWLLPVFWTPLTPPVRPRDLLGVLGPLMPEKYSPINPRSGVGNQKAYLARIPESAFVAILEKAEYDDSILAHGGSNSLTYHSIRETLDDVVERQISIDSDIDSTIKQSLIQARRGQGTFRTNVEAIDGSCRITGISNPSLLIASHIKPWRVCESSQERLDGMNGVMLTPDADLLFDRGFMSFEDDGNVLVSPRVNLEDLRRLGLQQLVWEHFGYLESPAVWHTRGFNDAQHRYLAYHRSEIFIA